jgi:hypothetical protein
MLILPPGHAETLRQSRTIRPRERMMIGGVLGVIALLAVAVVISFTTSGHKSGHGCISVGLAYSTGGAQIYRCGAAARQMCAGAGHPGGTVGAAARTVSTECRKAGLPVG